MSYKLPYIPNKALYAAVMGACSWIRDTGYFNKATQYYADKYDVDVKEVRRYVRLAQGSGQRTKNKMQSKRKYRWFAVEYSMGNERNGCAYFEPLEAHYVVRKGLSPESVKRTMSKNDDDISEYGLCHWFGRVEAFDSENDAAQRCEKWSRERKCAK